MDVFENEAVICLFWVKKDTSFTEDRKLNFLDNQSRVPLSYISPGAEEGKWRVAE